MVKDNMKDFVESARLLIDEAEGSQLTLMLWALVNRVSALKRDGKEASIPDLVDRAACAVIQLATKNSHINRSASNEAALASNLESADTPAQSLESVEAKPLLVIDRPLRFTPEQILAGQTVPAIGEEPKLEPKQTRTMKLVLDSEGTTIQVDFTATMLTPFNSFAEARRITPNSSWVAGSPANINLIHMLKLPSKCPLNYIKQADWDMYRVVEISIRANMRDRMHFTPVQVRTHNFVHSSVWNALDRGRLHNLLPANSDEV